MRVACGARLSEKPASLRFSKSADRPTRDERLPHTGCQGASGIGRLASALPDAAAAAAASGFVNTLLKRPLELDEGVHGHFVEQHAPHDGADHGAHPVSYTHLTLPTTPYV